jgi:ABC-2 type transport system ATP-binding protein
MGNQHKVGIVAAMLIEPEILVLDEPFANLDPSSQNRLKKMLIELREAGKTTLLISSHDLAYVHEICKRIVILEAGEVVKDIQAESMSLEELQTYFAVD